MKRSSALISQRTFERRVKERLKQIQIVEPDILNSDSDFHENLHQSNHSDIKDCNSSYSDNEEHLVEAAEEYDTQESLEIKFW